jgi:hypothetical protein
MCAPARSDGPLHAFRNVLGRTTDDAMPRCPRAFDPQPTSMGPAPAGAAARRDADERRGDRPNGRARLAGRGGSCSAPRCNTRRRAEPARRVGDVRCAALPRPAATRVARVVARVSRTRAGPLPSGEHREDPPRARAWGLSAFTLEFARHNASDLIALAWRGSLEPERTQTIQRVIRDASCPVIVFRVQA